MIHRDTGSEKKSQDTDDQEDPADAEVVEKSEKSIYNILNMAYAFIFRRYPLFFILVLGIVLRIISFTRISIWADGALYTDIGAGILKHGTFSTATNDLSSWAYSLTYPLYLSSFYGFLGFDLFSTQLASLIAGVLAILVVYITTADLFGKQKGLITAAIIALNPWTIFITGANLVENFLIIFISLTLWAIIKSSENRKYLALAGVFALLTYFTKTNIGVSAVIAATVFFVLWQVYYHKKRALKDPYLIIFVVIVIMGAFARNYLISQMPYQVSTAGTKASSLLTSIGLIRFVFQVPFHLLLPATYFLFFIPETYKGILDWKSRTNSLLILVLIGGIGLILLHATVRQTWLQTLPGASERYFTMFIVPTIWLFLGYLKLDGDNPVQSEKQNSGKERKIVTFGRFLIKKKKICFLFTLLIGGFIFILVDLWWGITLSIGAFSFFLLSAQKKRVTLFIIAFLVVGIGSTLDFPRTLQFTHAMDDMHNFVREGDIIAIDSDNSSFTLSSPSLYLSDINVVVIEYDPQDLTPKYIISNKNISYENYTLIKIYNDTSPIFLRAWIYTKLKNAFFDREDVWPRHPPIRLWIKD